MEKPPKKPLQRKEEPLEVGLARHHKSVRRTPSWLIEYGAWIVLGSFVVFVVVPLILLGRHIALSGEERSDYAQLQVSEAPTKVWVEGLSHELRSLQLVVSNAGPSSAQGVRVSVEIEGTKYALAGPVEIAAGKAGRYTGAGGATLRAEQEPTVQLDCSNCR